MSVSNLFGLDDKILPQFLENYISGGETGPQGPPGIPGTGIPQVGPTGPAGPIGPASTVQGPTGPQGESGGASSVGFMSGSSSNNDTMLGGQVFLLDGSTSSGPPDQYLAFGPYTYPAAAPSTPAGTGLRLNKIGTYMITVAGSVQVGNIDGSTFCTLICLLNDVKIPQSKITLQATINSVVASGPQDMTFFKRFIITTQELNSSVAIMNDVPTSQVINRSLVPYYFSAKRLK